MKADTARWPRRFKRGLWAHFLCRKLVPFACAAPPEIKLTTAQIRATLGGYPWIKAHRMPAAQRQAQGSQADELRKLKAELKRVTEERDILKKAAAYFAKQSG